MTIYKPCPVQRNDYRIKILSRQQVIFPIIKVEWHIKSASKLYNRLFRSWLVSELAPWHHLNQWWHFIKWSLWSTFRWNSFKIRRFPLKIILKILLANRVHFVSVALCYICLFQSSGWNTGPRFNIKTVFPMYGDSHGKDMTVARPSYL